MSVIKGTLIHIEALILFGSVQPFHVLPEGRLIWGHLNTVGAMILDFEFKVPVLNMTDQASVVCYVLVAGFAKVTSVVDGSHIFLDEVGDV